MFDEKINSKYCLNCMHKMDKEAKMCAKCGYICEEGKERSLEFPTQYLRIFDYFHNFLVGLLGVYVLGIVFGIIVKAFLNIGVTDPSQFNEALHIVLVNFLTYTFLITELVTYNTVNSKKSYYKELKNPKAYLIGIIAAIVLFAFSILYSIITRPLNIPVNDNQAEIVEMTLKYPVLSFITVIFFAPIVEELTYRVGLFNIFPKKYRWASYIISILVFTLLHINFVNPTNLSSELIAIPEYLVGAITLTFIYHKYGIAASLTAHIINNLIVFVLIFV